MRFVSPHRAYKAVVVPSDYDIVHGHKKMVRGLRVEFNDGVFDSVDAARRNQWTDEQRREVENYLISHENFNRRGGFYLADDNNVAEVSRDAQEAVVAGDDAEQCQVTFMTPEGSTRCGNRAKKGSRFCRVHEGVGERARVEAEV